MNGAAVRTGDNIDIIPIQITGNTAHIAYNKFFRLIAARTDPFRYKAIVVFITRPGSHDVAAAVDAAGNGIFSCRIVAAEVAGDAAYIVRTANVVFLIGGIGNICIHCASRDAAHVASHVISIFNTFVCCLLICAAAHVAGILYIGNSTSIGSRTGNATHIGNGYCLLFYTGSRMICICTGRIPRGGHIAAVFRILHSGIFHRADDAAHVIFPAYVQTVIDEVVFPAESRIRCSAHEAAHVGAAAGDAAQVIARAGQGASRERTDKPACIIFSILCRAGNSPGIDQIFKNRIPCQSDNTAHVGAAAGDGGAVHDVADLRAAAYLSGQSTHIVPAFDAAAYKGDIPDHSSVSDHTEKADVTPASSINIQIENIVIQSVKFAGK